jgi:two-component system, NtrC family, response regulator HydG
MTQQHELLIVDDSPNWREFLTMVFEGDYSMLSASSYDEAVKLIDNRCATLSVALVDLRLDDADKNNRDGMRLLQYNQAAHCGTKTIVLTAYPELDTTREAFRNFDAFDYLEKYPSTGGGLDIDHLRQVVRQAIGEPYVLLVEDDLQWADFLTEILSDEGYIVERVANSADALERLRARGYPVAVVDLKLGDESPERGIKLLQQAQRFHSQARLIVVSGYSSREKVRDAFEQGGASAFIFKDEFDPAQFREKVRYAGTGRWIPCH